MCDGFVSQTASCPIFTHAKTHTAGMLSGLKCLSIAWVSIFLIVSTSLTPPSVLFMATISLPFEQNWTRSFSKKSVALMMY